jgi:hypothetical protein
MILAMPAEITMSENLAVRCRAKVLRTEPGTDQSHPMVAIRIEHYEFLPREVTPVNTHSEALHTA